MLIKNILSNLPLYLISIMPMPRKIKFRLYQLQQNLLRDEGFLEMKPHLGKWLVVCLDRKSGGAGVKDLSKLNKTLLCKWS